MVVGKPWPFTEKDPAFPVEGQGSAHLQGTLEKLCRVSDSKTSLRQLRGLHFVNKYKQCDLENSIPKDKTWISFALWTQWYFNNATVKLC